MAKTVAKAKSGSERPRKRSPRISHSEQCKNSAARLCVESVDRPEDLQLGQVTRRERTFLLEKLVGLSDRRAAIAAGYSLSMANNTKQKIWSRPNMLEEMEALKLAAARQLIQNGIESREL